jgi:O-antigen/teichoic acid export membrane protein
MIEKIKLIFGDKDFFEIINKAGFFLIFRVLAFLFAYVFALFVIKYYGTDNYGLVTLSFTILMVTSVICRFGFDVSLTKIFSIKNSSSASAHYFNSILIAFFLTALIGYLIFIFSQEISVYIFSKPNFQGYLQWTAVSIPLWTLLLINIGVFRGLKKVFYYSTLDNFGRFLLSIVILAIFILINSNNQYDSIISHFFGLLILFFISTYCIWRSLKNKKIKNFKYSKKFVVSSFPIMLSSSIVIFLAWSDKIILGIYDTEENIAIYDIAIRIATLIIFNLEAINSILSSKISSFYHENKLDELNRVIQFSSKVNIVIAFVVFLVLIFFSKFILNFFGSDFIIGRTALIILALGQLFNAFCGPVGNILHMTGHQKEFRNIMGVTLAVNILLNILLIKKFGINGAAVATTISLIIWNFSGVILIKKKLGINSYYTPFKL